MNSIQRAVLAAGGATAAAAKLKLTRQAVERWARKKHVPADRVLALEALSGVPRHELRPDLYPKEKSIAS
jgi:DNA-binding transcriptional regulator YdaS (Cro superfamily)